MKSSRRLERSSGGQTTLKLYGIFGHPLVHTLSPAFQEAGFEEAGILAHYLVFDFRRSVFKKTMRQLNKIPLRGFNVTVPYKQTVIPYLDWITDSAKTIGAVNTVYRVGDKWCGTNTDADGFWQSLQSAWRWKAKGKSVLLLGAGGAARAVLFALASRGVKTIAVSNRTETRAQELVRDFSKLFPKTQFFATAVSEKADLLPFELIVNTTSLGLHAGDESIVDQKMIPSATQGKKYFVDLIYNPAETDFLKSARKKGHQTLNGLDMLLYQGAKAFEIWTGKKAPVETMRKALADALKEKQK